MKEMKKIISLVLCFVMVVGLLPMNVFAVELDSGNTEPTYSTTVEKKDPEVSDDATEPTNSLTVEEENGTVIKDGLTVDRADLQAVPQGLLDAAAFLSDVHGSTSDLQNTLPGLNTSGITYSSISFLGDTMLTMATVEGIVDGVLTNDPDILYVCAPKHDNYENDKEAGDCDIDTKWNFSGLALETDYYYVYTVYEPHMQYYNQESADAAQAFIDWANNETTDHSKPVFVISHRPMHQRRYENLGAFYWYDALTEVADQMDVFFLWGHNHYQENATLDVNAYYVAKDGTEKLIVQGPTQYENKSEVPNFTYMCAGYLNANRDVYGNSPKRIGLIVTAEIYADKIIFQDYTKDGAYTGDNSNNYYHIGVEVAREFAAKAPTLDALTISGKTEYVEGDELALTVTASYSDGTSVDVTKEATITGYDMSKAGTYTVTATYEGKTATIEITVAEDVFVLPEGYELNRVEVTNLGETKYFLGEALDVSGLTVTAVYTKQDAETLKQILKPLGGDVTDGYTVSEVDMTTTGKQYVTVTYGGKTGSFAIEVYLKTYTNDAGDVTVEFSNHGVTSATVTAEEKEVEGYTAYVTYDITPVGYTQGDDATVTVTVNTDLFDATRPVAVLDQGEVLIVTNIVDGKVTFVTNHFSEYDVTQVDVADLTWTEIPGESKTIFRLTDSLTSGKTYVIVNDNAAGAANAVNLTISGYSSSITSVEVEVIADSKGNYIEAPNDTAQWTYNANKNFRNVDNPSSYLRGRSTTGSLRVGNSTSSYIAWNYSTTYGLYGSNDSYNMNSSFSLVARASSNRVYLYVEEPLTIPGGYAALSGQTNYSIGINVYANEAAVKAMIKSNMAVLLATDANGTGATPTEDYELTGTCNPAEAGTYTYTVSYMGKNLGTITVKVVDKIAKSVVLNTLNGEVERGSGDDVATGAYLTVTWDDDTVEQVPVTVGMLSGNFTTDKNGTYKNLTVTYGGKTAQYDGQDASFTLKVVNIDVSEEVDYPAYPNPGSVDVDKSATGLDFQNTGAARVELSTSGLPVSKGIDVIVMLDTSSSMTRCIYCSVKSGSHSNSNCPNGAYRSRLSELNDALDDMIKTFGAKNPDGSDQDIRIAIRDFNGAVSGATARDTADRTVDAAGLTGSANLTEFTGSGLGAGAFVDVAENYDDLLAINVTTTASGTNYDYAFDAIYQMGQAIKAANAEAGVERDLFVIFMSDGAPNYYNYYGSQGGNSATDGSDDWNYWLTGAVGKSVSVVSTDGTTKVFDGTNVELSDIVQTSSHYHYFFEETGNQHRMANAVKGDPNTRYEIIRKATGLTGMQSTGETNMYTVPGLGATMYSVAFTPANDGRIQKEAMLHVLRNIATTREQHYFEATEAGALANAFNAIAKDIKMAATNARFIDQMGSSFNLQLNPSVPSNNTDAAGEDGMVDINTDITITTHNIYTKDDAPTPDDIGKPYGTGTNMETVSFDVAEDGTVTATSSVLDGNIMKDGVICAKYFFYNTNSTPRDITLADGSTYNLPAETFYWNIGIINEKQWTLSYTVMLEGALEGDGLPAGGYATNNFAILYYDNHIGNEVSKSIASPTMAWEAAQVSYAFYLVNDAGEPVHADGTKADSFLLAHRVTQPVVYKSVELNKQGGTTLDASALAVLPTGYELFAPDATYTVYIRSGAGGSADTENPSSWTITGDDKATTYVMGYAGATDYSKAQSVSDESYNYTNTTVYFAVKWNIGTVPDTVVIDYGLDVDINVIANDMFGKDGTLHAVGMASNMPTGHGTPLASGFNTASVTGQFGTASIVNGKIRYSLDKTKGTAMNDAEYLAYAVDYKGSSNPGFYYGALTIIPATTVYYEDEYVTLATYNANNEKIADGWPTDSVHATAIQGEDRPGQHNLGTIDANNIYGFDGAYDHMSSFSMGAAAKIHVDNTQYGTAQFDFYGTGFDVFSVTSNNTGTLIVQVNDASGNPVVIDGKPVSYAVDTYYGYVYGLYEVVYQKNDKGQWNLTTVNDIPENVTDPEPQTKDEITSGVSEGTATGYQYTWKAVENNPNALYQVPVMKIDGLPYGKYTAKITALYYEVLDHTTPGGYDLYLDAIRIYNPAGTSDADLGETIKKAYAADGELYPSYHELRNLILDSEVVHTNLSENAAAAPGIVFIDGNATLSDATGNNIKGTAIADYTNFGPNNELYLASKQAVAFFFQAPTQTGYVPVVRIGMKTVGGKAAVAELWNVSGTTKLNAMSKTIETATDMYYDISVLNGGTIVITNSGEAGSILSITDIKVTYKSTEASAAGIADVNEAQIPDVVFYVNNEVVEGALETLIPDRVDKILQITPSDKPIKDKNPLRPVTPGKPVISLDPIAPGKPVRPIRPGKGNQSCISIGEAPGLTVARKNAPRCVIE